MHSQRINDAYSVASMAGRQAAIVRLGRIRNGRIGVMLHYLTAGESHGRALVATLEGLPAHVQVGTADIRTALARRRLGFGRGARMSFEADDVTLLAGVRHGETLGSPVAIMVGNTEWTKWTDVMNPDEVDPAVLAGLERNAPLTRPRPGHADLPGMQKYDWAEARPVLERASARETAARVALGEVARRFLAQAFGITVVSQVVGIADIVVPDDHELPRAADLPIIDADPVRCFDPAASTRMVARIEQAQRDGDTLGGVVEVVAWGCPPGLGSYSQGDRRLDARLAGALMGIQAIKGVGIGLGFEAARRPGSRVHDELAPALVGRGVRRLGDNAGGIEGGVSNGSPIVAYAAMKPIATVPKALRTVDVAAGTAATANHQRSDTCAVPAAAVVAEAEVARVLAAGALEKFGGDSVDEARRNSLSYLARVREQGLELWP
jgi:chorismate synthase